jgi:hypothetical protein
MEYCGISFIGIYWNLSEFIGIYRNLSEFIGIYRNLSECIGMYRNLLLAARGGGSYTVPLRALRRANKVPREIMIPTRLSVCWHSFKMLRLEQHL